MLKYTAEINNWIDKNKDGLLKDWISICRTPAIKGEPGENAPFGAECAKGLKECTELFKKRGFEAKTIDKSGYSLISYGNGEKTIGIFTHSDVVPVGEDWLYTKPFEPIIKNGALIGRGVEDNKSGIMATLCALEIFREFNIPLKSRIQLFIGSNEETGMEDIKAFKNEQPMPEISLIPDADFPCSTGEKGICQLYAKCNSAFDNVIDFCGGEAFNIVLDKATVTLKKTDALKAELDKQLENNTEITLTENCDTISLCAKGIAKHASIPEGSVNAAYLLAGLLSETKALSENDRDIMSKTAHILSCPFGSAVGIDFCDDLFGKLTFVNGMVSLKNGCIQLSFDMRYSSALETNDLINRTKAAFNSLGWDIEVKDNMPGFSIDPDSKIPELFENIYREISGFDKKSFKLGGGTYARHIDNAFSVGTFCETADRKEPVFEMPAGHGGAHQCDEMIDIESFFAAVRIIVQYLLAMDEEINTGC